MWRADPKYFLALLAYALLILFCMGVSIASAIKAGTFP